jgi:voltage-gated potassium channel Kch
MALPAADRLFSWFSRGKRPRVVLEIDEQQPPSTHVLIVGFGPAGQQVVQHFQELGLKPIIVDVNPQSRRKARQLGVNLYLGDAANEEILLHAGLADACMAVITTPDPTTSARVMDTLRHLRPEIPIAVRCRYNRHFDMLRQAGADIIVDEESIVGNTLAHKIVEFLQEASGTLFACRLSGTQPSQIVHRTESQ